MIIKLTFGVPEVMAMERPDTRVICQNAYDNVRKPRNSDGVSPHGVVKIPRRSTLSEQSVTPANDLEVLAAIGVLATIIAIVRSQKT